MPNIKAPGWHQWNSSNLGIRDQVKRTLRNTSNRSNHEECLRKTSKIIKRCKACKMEIVKSDDKFELIDLKVAYSFTKNLQMCCCGPWTGWFMDRLVWVQSCGTSSFINPTSARVLQSPSFYYAQPIAPISLSIGFTHSPSPDPLWRPPTSDATDWCEASKRIRAHQSTNLLGFVCLMTHQITKHNTDIFQSRSACSPNMHGRQWIDVSTCIACFQTRNSCSIWDSGHWNNLRVTPCANRRHVKCGSSLPISSLYGDWLFSHGGAHGLCKSCILCTNIPFTQLPQS